MNLGRIGKATCLLVHDQRVVGLPFGVHYLRNKSINATADIAPSLTMGLPTARYESDKHGFVYPWVSDPGEGETAAPEP